MRQISLVIGIALVLLIACQPPAPTPVLLDVVPTQVILPPVYTRTPLPSRTARPTRALRPTRTPAPTLTPTPIELIPVVIAIRPIPAGNAIPPEAVLQVWWPQIALSFDPISDVDTVINQVNLYDLGCFEPISAGMLARRTLGSGFLAFPDSCGTPPDVGAEPAMQMVVIASEIIERGTIINPSQVALRPWPGAYVTPSFLRHLTQVIGHSAQNAVFEGQPIQAHDLME